MEKTIDIIVQIFLIAVLFWTLYMFNKAMHLATHPYDNPKTDSKN